MENAVSFPLDVNKIIHKQMKFGVVVFPGSNCDRDMYDALKYDLGQEVTMLWHKGKWPTKLNKCWFEPTTRAHNIDKRK